MGRAPCCDKANVKKGPWSPEEDAKLKAYMEKYGTGGNWLALPQKIGLKRCGKSCRLRWLNYLRPNLKHGGFSEEEDNLICSLFISIGSRWSIIAAQLPGRTDNDIKNYWNTRLKKKLLGARRKQPDHEHRLSSTNKDNYDSSNSNNDSPPLSNSALERIQLHMQLQRLNNPLSLYNNNNPALWPSPIFHEKMAQGLLDVENPTNYSYPHQMKISNDPENSSNFSEPIIIPLVQHKHEDSAEVITFVENAGPKDDTGMMKQMIVYDHHQMYMQQGLSGDQTTSYYGIPCNYYNVMSNSLSLSDQENHHHQMLDFECFRGILDDSSSSALALSQYQEESMFKDYSLEVNYNNL